MIINQVDDDLWKYVMKRSDKKKKLTLERILEYQKRRVLIFYPIGTDQTRSSYSIASQWIFNYDITFFDVK